MIRKVVQYCTPIAPRIIAKDAFPQLLPLVVERGGGPAFGEAPFQGSAIRDLDEFCSGGASGPWAEGSSLSDI
jgi:hypothetical protein